MPKEKQNYLGNPLLKSTNVAVQYTPEQVKEYMKCAEDPVYFIRNYVKINNLDRGVINFEMYPFQQKIVETIHNNRFIIALLSRQSGKCVYINTNIKVRNKRTGEIKDITIGDLYEQLKQSKSMPLLPNPNKE